MVLGKKWLFSIGNGAGIRALEKGRKSPVKVPKSHELASNKYQYSKTCIKRTFKIGQNKNLNYKWQHNEGRKYCRTLPMKVESIAECSPWSLNTFECIKAIISLENQFSVFLRVAILHRFYCTNVSAAKFGLF